MKNRFHGAAALSVLAVSALALSACTSTGGGDAGGGEASGSEVALISPGTLRACSDIPYVPFTFTENGETVGYDTDVMDRIAEDLGVQTEWVTTGFEGIQSGAALDTEQCDIAAGGMTITEQRESVMDFSDPYLDDNLALLVTPDSGIDSVADIAGRRVGVQQATTGETYAQDNGAEIVQFEDSTLLTQALSTGDVEAVVANISIAGTAVTDNPDLRIAEEIETGEQLGLAVRTGNTALLDRVNESLATMTEDGTLDELRATWFGTDSSASPEPSAS